MSYFLAEIFHLRRARGMVEGIFFVYANVNYFQALLIFFDAFLKVFQACLVLFCILQQNNVSYFGFSKS